MKTKNQSRHQLDTNPKQLRSSQSKEMKNWGRHDDLSKHAIDKRVREVNDLFARNLIKK